MAEPERSAPGPRGFWSGTITFGLVSVPVDLYPAVRSSRVPLRMLGPEGQPLVRRYFCSADDQPLTWDDIVRGYEWEDGSYTIVTDEELEAVAPRKSRDIDLRRFVQRAEIPPRLLERTYILAPSGDSTKAYHLLAETMERTGRVGIATFVMRGKEYLAAIFAEGGLLRAATMRFIDELRTPADVGLPEPSAADAKRRRAMAEALANLEAEALDVDLLRDEQSAALLELAERKRAEARDVVEVAEEVPPEDETEAAEVIDIMSVLKRRMGADGDGARRAEPRRAAAERRRDGGGAGTRASGKKKAAKDALAGQSKEALYERAKALDIPGRSGMSKEELIEAIRKAS
ncbi:MAG TPA: Ku protein [Gammaproteobacteria bacterium]